MALGKVDDRIGVEDYRALTAAKGRESCGPQGRRGAAKNRANPEESLQRTIFEEVFLREKLDRRLRYLHHIPNGGARSAAEGGILKATGVRKGVSDLCLPLSSPCKKWKGIYCECKSDRGVLSDDQRGWLQEMSRDGYLVGLVRSPDEFWQLYEIYLGLRSEKIAPGILEIWPA